MSGSAKGVVREFWRLMASNDFSSLQAVLADEFILEWPEPYPPPERRKHLVEPIA
ncbi:MAG: hypothetical protein IPK72_18470 [Candidatus Eisenbacteria bacterium]|nr:hypothetical protein [Candidatus Eisenbacteria bacterium]